MKKGKKYEEELKRIIAKEYYNGKTVKEIAKEYNISLSSVYKWRHEYLVNNYPEVRLDGFNSVNILEKVEKLKNDNEKLRNENESLKKTISILIKNI